jgi:uncharacterized protein YndB with AHSA1/START domain
MTAPDRLRLERTYHASPATIWRLWTTADGIVSWWAPDGFTAEVRTIDVRPGGELVHALTATSPEMVAFVEGAGLPRTTEATKTFVEVDEPRRLTYISLVDFVPDHEPYEHLTEVDLTPDGDATTVVMTVEPLHDAVWTERLVAGRANELDNLAAVLAA